MIVRLVLAVVVAAALLGAALPVVEDARHDVATTTADRTVQSVADAITDLRRSSDPVPRGVPGATRVIDVEVPADGAVLIGAPATIDGGLAPAADGGTNGSAIDGPGVDVIAARVAARETARIRVPLDVRAVENGRVQSDGAGLAVRESGRVLFRYVLVGGEPTVTVASV
ncbi:MAG: hypothetical protein ABEJ44_06515 [Halanaeroarchaeum sp.]